LIEELLFAQGWDIRRPPSGELLTQQEYKDHPALREALVGSSKSGGGAGVPEYVLVERETAVPLAVFEAKARAHEIDAATGDVQRYVDAFFEAGFSPIAVAVAGTKDDRFAVRIMKRLATRWADITYDGSPITWIPNREQLERIRRSPRLTELRPAVPPIEVLKERAEEINGLLRESGLKDDFRPAAIGAIMLGLWKSKGNVRRDTQFILSDINQACGQAFRDAQKSDLAKSLRVDEANKKLATRARRIVEILERLNIATLTAEHDYLGALYEEFFRYTGGNTIGQYFTPRHITKLMADLCEISGKDVVLDPACGTGGFLIAAMERMQTESKLSREQIVEVVQEQLIGLEDEPVTASLCVANMILRGDGTSGVHRADCFDDRRFPFDRAHVVLMNPPFPHKKTDVSPDAFIDRALEGVQRRGKAAIVVPSSLLVKGDRARWRDRLLKDHTLLAVITLPGELFQPYAASTTAIVLLEKGIPHTPDRRVFFCRIENDGFRLRKGVRVPVGGSQVSDALKGYNRLANRPGFCASSRLSGEDWAPGAYIKPRSLSDTRFRDAVAELIRDKTASVIRFAPQLASLERAVEAKILVPRIYTKSGHSSIVGFSSRSGATVADLFDIYYGQSELESKDALGPGLTLVISSTGMDNGAYGFFEFSDVLKPPFVTVPRTGSIGEARVQEFPCGVTSDCLLLIPKADTPFEALYVAAATLREERWRFDYSRKMTPSRIAKFPLRLDSSLLAWVRAQWDRAHGLESQALQTAIQNEDE
jgi:predicted RNA methylase